MHLRLDASPSGDWCHWYHNNGYAFLQAPVAWSDTLVHTLQVKQAKEEADAQMQQDLNVIITQHNLIIEKLQDQIQDFDERFQVRHAARLGLECRVQDAARQQ
jgi:hypothetical protein